MSVIREAGAEAFIDGEVDSGFGPVFDALAANFDLRGEVRAAVAGNDQKDGLHA
jgi:hypothetical protein